ncbi:uncharacterized protein LOC107041212 [Diachasma alloeum]|uniref:uncharacterized protein LOC107041212 n=1 Tax=Diachasma alloeum TaxID=454923 RepID=UPI000738498C|nr:uncharacterized protein LOC107041212 [Diachasma alloeum]
MTLNCVTWLFAIVFTVQGQGDSNSTPPPPSVFSCRGRDTGFYADIASNCEVYHTCDNHGNKFTYYCPKETKFCQETLVCDHAHLVNCRNAEKLISQVAQGADKTDKAALQSSSPLSRSFRISPQPSVFLEAPAEDSNKSTTFTMSATVFLRNSSAKKNDKNRNSVSSTSERSSGIQFKSRDANEFPREEKPRTLRFEGSQGGKTSTSKPFFSQRGNYPQGETPSTARTTTAGTEFPIPAFNIETSGYSGNEEDPYYPKRTTSTEIYYTLERERVVKPLAFLSTERPFANSVNIKIPDVLPDLNSIDDLVDRRKILYIPRTKGL